MGGYVATMPKCRECGNELERSRVEELQDADDAPPWACAPCVGRMEQEIGDYLAATRMAPAVCVGCRVRSVDPLAGEDTCAACLADRAAV